MEKEFQERFPSPRGRSVRPEKKKLGGSNTKKASDFGMLSVKAGIDDNPNPTKADRIAGSNNERKTSNSQ